MILTGGGEVAVGDTTGSGIPWELLLLFGTGSSLGTEGGTTGSSIPEQLLLLFNTGSSLGTESGTLVGEVAPDNKKKCQKNVKHFSSPCGDSTWCSALSQLCLPLSVVV